MTKKAAKRQNPILAGALFVSLTALAGCSSVPDALNPAEWYQGTVDFFSGENEEGQVAEQTAPQPEELENNPGEGQAFPNLGSVPERPVPKGLVADTKNRKYAEPIARQGEAADTLVAQAPAPAPAPSPTPSMVPQGATQPAPPPTPAMPVTSSPAIDTLTPPSAPSLSLTDPTQMASLPANAETFMGPDVFETIVVSSSGVSKNAAMQEPGTTPMQLPTFGVPATAPAAAAQASAPSLTTALQRPSAPIVSGTKVATILFTNGSAGLSGHDRRILAEVAKLQKSRGAKMKIIGHSSSRTRNMDPVKHKMVNYKLSVARADKVASQLMRLGVASADISVDARSDSNPLYYEFMPTGEAGNRRAEIYFVN